MKALSATIAVALLGLLVLSQGARMLPRPATPGHPGDTMTGPMFRWMVEVLVLGLSVTTALVLAGVKAIRSRGEWRHVGRGLHSPTSPTSHAH